MDDAETLLADLQGSPTDLARIVTEVLRKRPATLYVSRQTVEAWDARDPAAWARVCAWLAVRGVRVDIGCQNHLCHEGARRLASELQ